LACPLLDNINPMVQERMCCAEACGTHLSVVAAVMHGMDITNIHDVYGTWELAQLNVHKVDC